MRRLVSQPAHNLVPTCVVMRQSSAPTWQYSLLPGSVAATIYIAISHKPPEQGNSNGFCIRWAHQTYAWSMQSALKAVVKKTYIPHFRSIANYLIFLLPVTRYTGLATRSISFCFNLFDKGSSSAFFSIRQPRGPPLPFHHILSHTKLAKVRTFAPMCGMLCCMQMQKRFAGSSLPGE